jgi:Protein of unknown function (DUF2750)
MSRPETWELNDEEFRAVSALEAGQRYDHLVKRVADWQWIWLLDRDAGPVHLEDDEGTGYVAIWPHSRYAEASANHDWPDARPRAIEIHEWAGEWLPQLAADGLMLAAFPTPADQGYIVPPLGMKEDVETELSLYE